MIDGIDMGMENRSSPRQTSTAGRFRRRMGAKALVTSNGRVLLVRERHADGTPFWTLPGGGLCPDESAPEGLRRELDEELDCRARVAEPVSKFWYIHRSCGETVSVYTVYDCSLLSEPAPNAEEGVFESRWVDPDSVPTGTLPQVQYVCETAVGRAVPASD